jgi:uncharacterized membrane protein
MAEMLLIWIVAPVVLLALCFGLGLLFAVIFKKELKFFELIALGLLTSVVLGSVMTLSTQAAQYTAPLIGLLSALGIAVCLIRYRQYLKFDRLAAGAGAITYTLFSLPVAMYGKPSWAGWVQLDDNSSWYGITNRLLTLGHSVPSPILTTYDRVLQTYLGTSAFNYGAVHDDQFSYPTGALIPFGVLSKIVHLDMAWLFQPFLSFCAALVAMLFVETLRSRLRPKYLVVLGASFAALASTIFSYVMWGGIKEIVLIIPIVLFTLKTFSTKWNQPKVEDYAYFLICVSGLYFIGAKTSLGFIIPIVFVALLVEVSRRNRRYFHILLGASWLIAVGGIFSLATGGTLLKFLVPQIKDMGNLYGQLSPLQVVGIWPVRDFRFHASWIPFTYPAIFIAISFAVLAVYKAVKRGEWLIPSLILASTAVVTFSYLFAGAWITGKAVAVVSPIVLLTVVHGIWEETAAGEPRRILGAQRLATKVITVGMVGAVICGVLVSDALTYRNVWLAPYSQMDELRVIGHDFAGQGPTFMADYSPYGARYFLRDAGAESASELRVHLLPLRNGTEVPKGGSADIDYFQNSGIDYFNLLVLRKSGRLSRPPLNYSLARSGTNYEVWKRNTIKYVVQKTLPLGNNLNPAATPSCAQVASFLAGSKAGDKIFTVDREKSYVVPFSGGDLPLGWTASASVPGGVNFTGPGGFSRNIAIDQDKEYRFWLSGSYPGQLEIQIDGVQVFTGHSLFEGNTYLTNPIGGSRLTSGTHLLTVIYKTPWFMSGAGALSSFGPIYISSQTAGESRVRAVSIAQIPKLCTQNLDWIAIAR